MTNSAREVLEDCRVALTLLEEETDLRRWRIHWAAAVSLIRAVGHVLDKVDGRDPVRKAISKEFFQRWKEDPEHEIFPKFIEHERNNLLKEYASDVNPMEKVPILLQRKLVPLGGGAPIDIADVVDLGENIYRPLLDGPWEGIDCREVLEEAIRWWECELSAVDDAVKLSKRAP